MESKNDKIHKELVDNYKKVYKVILYRTGYDEELAKDICQEAYEKMVVLINNNELKNDDNVSGLLFIIAKNLLIDHQKKEKLIRRYKNNKKRTNKEDVRLIKNSVEDAIIKNENINDVKIAINKLPEDQQELIYQLYYKKMKFVDIANETGTSINTLLGRKRYAIKNLKKLLKSGRKKN